MLYTQASKQCYSITEIFFSSMEADNMHDDVVITLCLFIKENLTCIVMRQVNNQAMFLLTWKFKSELKVICKLDSALMNVFSIGGQQFLQICLKGKSFFVGVLSLCFHDTLKYLRQCFFSAIGSH